MSSLVHRSVPTNFKWFPNCSPAHTLLQDRFKDVQVGARVQYTVHSLTKFHTKGVLVAQLVWRHSCVANRLPVVVSISRWSASKPQVVTRRKAKGADQKNHQISHKKVFDSCSMMTVRRKASITIKLWIW